MLNAAFTATFPNEQLNTWLPTAPLIAQVPGPPYAGLIFQLIPAPAGNGSFSVALFAVAADPFEIAIVNPIGFPAVTVAASGVLVTVTNPAVAGGIATTASLNTLLLPPIPASTLLFGS